MSQENVKVVERAIAAINERDVEGYLALCTADVELVSPVASLEGTGRGADGVRHYFSMMDDATSSFRLDVERVEGVGDDRVLAFTRISGVSAGGVPFAQPTASLYVVGDGKISCVQVFLDRQEALEAVGYRE